MVLTVFKFCGPQGNATPQNKGRRKNVTFVLVSGELRALSVRSRFQGLRKNIYSASCRTSIPSCAPVYRKLECNKYVQQYAFAFFCLPVPSFLTPAPALEGR